MIDTTTPKSLGAMLRRSVRNYPDKVSHMIPEGKNHRSMTYSEFFECAYSRAKALDELGLKRGDRVVIMGETGFEWALTDWAAQTLGVVTVPIYPTLPPDQAQYIANDCGASVAICSDDKQVAKLTGIKLVTWEAGQSHPITEFGANSTLDRQQWEANIDLVEPSELATLIYTSGTTGQPKGVMLAHRNFTQLSDNIRDTLPIENTDLFLSWLPLSHVFERYAGHVLPMAVGATVAYTNVASLGADMQKLNPSIVLCVPRMLESIRARVIENVSKQPPIRQKLFALAQSQGMTKVKGGFAPLAGVLDKLVGAKIRERTGSRLKFFVSGGAALPPHVTEFFLAFNITVLQGYGLTETTAASSLNPPHDNRPETVGPAIKGVEMKIAADGEILIKGDSVMLGYYNLPDATREAIDADGWFHTGDIGVFDGPYLKITDRKKDLLVLGNGKNVAPQPVENKLKESDFISEVVLLGDGMEYCCALIVPEFDRVSAWLATQGVTEMNPSALVTRDDVKALIKKEVDAANKQLADFEKVKRHVLVGKAFSVDDGELTPSLKVRRKVVKEKYADQISSMQRPSV